PQHAMGLRQGITTEFLGIDGMSYAPLSAPNYRLYRRWLAGVLGEPPEDLDMSSIAAFRRHYDRRVAVNTAYLVPFATVRLEAVGFRDVPLRGRELERARSLVEEGLQQGAVGFSTGSKYYPGPWGDTEELRGRRARNRAAHGRAPPLRSLPDAARQRGAPRPAHAPHRSRPRRRRRRHVRYLPLSRGQLDPRELRAGLGAGRRPRRHPQTA